MLLFLLLRALRARGLSRRSEVDDLWLTAMFGVGSVYYFCSVVGEVWFTAQIIAVTLSIVYVWASIEARRPALAGICVALGFATRPALAGAAALPVRGGARRRWPRGVCASRVCAPRAARRRWLQVRGADRRRRRGAGRLQLRALPKPVRVRAQVHAGAVAGPDVPLRPLQLPLPVAQPGRRAGAPAAHHDPLSRT